MVTVYSDQFLGMSQQLPFSIVGVACLAKMSSIYRIILTQFLKININKTETRKRRD